MVASAPIRRIDHDRDKVLGCWLGKAVGGTLGQTFEGLPGPIYADFYVPVPDGMVPNDDLDLQVLYAWVIDRMPEPAVDRYVLARAWAEHVEFPWNEYGVAKRNLTEGIPPPYTGSFDNWYTTGEGAAIRSELWACLAPGDPELAAAYAYEDACFDHAGEGIWASTFLAALQSLAFVESDPDVLLDRAASMLPVTSDVRQAVNDTRLWVGRGLAWEQVRELLVTKYATKDFTDVRMNTGFVVLGWLASGGNFDRAITITNGCGEDTDSSTASLGALLGILDPAGIPDKWLGPIGSDLVLNDAVVGITPPPTVEAFTDLVLELRQRLNGRRPAPAESTFDPDAYAIPVTMGWADPFVPWGERDASGLAPAGAAPPEMPDNAVRTTLPGTWARLAREDFLDRILVLRYQLQLERQTHARIMFNCSEEFRLWLDGTWLFGAQPSVMRPAPHSPPMGQWHDLVLPGGEHELLVTVAKPPAHRTEVEWVVAVAEHPGFQWVPHAFRPVRTAA